ncbi:constitutive coactivator of peroxisome proliferator-activated receptor gamma [Centropristis striata]|uniref:constitutive coactivator of peroxisome proliferator-activated receptor gamma n=1 Tax=Centropristis striata TaxID=184440 RepID=UPI0027DFA05A|nr:constitutive coactivator of peroxisome proliferator-activated receptor gamma [Centropristis striata]
MTPRVHNRKSFEFTGSKHNSDTSCSCTPIFLNMGVKGLQGFLERCCPEACVPVNLREMAKQHVAKSQQGCTTTANTTNSPTLVVDGMACLRRWYSCQDWVCGGQWREYMDVLRSWVEAFTSAGIRLVFIFDGVVEEKKRQAWVKRRRRVNGEISKIFNYLKAHGEHPGRELFSLPSGLAGFTPFALRSLGQEVFCSVQEADYEIASYARQHGCMGILGQDSDFIIYDSAPYLSVEKLRIKSLTTIMYDRQRLCQTLGLTVAQLPLLACLLGNDVVSEEMQNIRNNAMATYRSNYPTPHSGAVQGQMVLAVSHLVSSLWGIEETDLIPQSLNLSAPHRELLKRGVRSYLLPGHEALQQGDISALPSAFEKHVSPEILKACREKHVAAEGFTVYSVVCEGVVQCSNTLEDGENDELLPQALVYKLCRQRTYGLILLHERDGSSIDLPAVKEWFVYPGNPLKEPDMVHPIPVSLPCDQPSLDLLWFGTGPEVSVLRLTSFLTIFDCQELSELYRAVEDSLLAALCLVTYIALQVQTLSQEDLDAYLSQAVCLRLKTPEELQQIKLPFLSSRAVQLGYLYVRGLSHMLGANCASGCPLPSAAIMPWHSFDGRLFHSKYLLAHNGTEETELLDRDPSCLSLFLRLREKLQETCRRHGRVLQSRPRAPEHSHKATPGPRYRERHSGRPPGGGESWRERGEMTGGQYQHHGGGGGGGWRERAERGGDPSVYENRERLWERGGGVRGGHFHHHTQSYPERGRSYRSRGRYQLAPRWSQPPAPGT